MMQKVQLVAILLSALASAAIGQINPWTSVQEDAFATQAKLGELDKYSVFGVDLDHLEATLPNAVSPSSRDPKGEMLLPTADGGLELFEYWYSPVVAPGLQSKYPEIRTYKLVSIENPGRSGRLTVSPYGIDGLITGDGPETVIERLNSESSVVVFNASDIRYNAFESNILACGADMQKETQAGNSTQRQRLQARSAGQDVQMRTYRTAIAATGEWTIQSGGTVQAGMSRMISSVNIINQVLESEVAIRLELIDNNDTLIFTNPDTDPYFVANLGRELLSVNTGVINSRVGVGAYDFGHVFTGTCSDVGGVASLASVCTSRKGAAVTCWYTANIQYVSIRIAAHEMGHQMAANHTFNNCNGNEAQGNAYEPGSGSTIMSYYGLCGDNNASGNFVPNYHVASLEEIIGYMHNGGGNGCATRIPTSNITPDVTIQLQDSFFIPISTPFELSCEGSDENGDELWYTWEQFDLGPGQRPRCMPSGNSPLFRSVAPDRSPTRIFPDLSLILNGQDDCYELLPEVSRDMTFRVTARDLHPEGGGVDWDELSFYATAKAGPFTLNYPNEIRDTLWGGQYMLFTWDVANTDKDPVNCKQVDIIMFKNNNYTQGDTLLRATENDGSAYVLIPNERQTNVRIKVKAADNVFFDMSDFAHRIVPTEEATFTAALSGNSAFVCLPDVVEESLTTLALFDYDAPLSLGVAGSLPTGFELTYERDTIFPGEEVGVRLDFSQVSEAGIFQFELTITDTAGNVVSLPYSFETVSQVFDDLALVEPAADITGISELPDFSWQMDPNADSYTFQLAKNPAFDPEDILVERKGMTASTFTPDATLELNKLYYWRVIPFNRCGEGQATAVRAFSTRALVCQTFQDQPELSLPRGTSRQDLLFNVSSTAEIVDVNVTGVEGRYDNVRNLTLSLTSPQGTKVALFKDYQCNSPLFNLGFDDEAPAIMPCPPNTEQSIQPAEPLSVLIGENALGDWRLTVETGSFGNGGVLNSWALEVCTNSSLSGPFYVIKDTLQTKPNTSQPLHKEVLEVRDPDNSAAEIYYVLVETPLYGELQLNGATLRKGDAFNQSSINGWVVDYVHGGGTEAMDYFLFTVTDNAGGWLGIDTFYISIDEDNVVGISERHSEVGLRAFPNPAEGQLTVEITALATGDSQMRLLDLTGKTHAVWADAVPGKQLITLPQVSPGVYLLEFVNGQGRAVQKIVLK